MRSRGCAEAAADTARKTNLHQIITSVSPVKIKKKPIRIKKKKNVRRVSGGIAPPRSSICDDAIKTLCECAVIKKKN